MAVTTTKTNKPVNPRGNDASPKGYNRAALYSGKALDFDGANDFISTGTQTAFDMKSIAFHFIGAIDSGTNGFVMHPNDAQYNKGVMIGHFTATLTDECLSIGDGANYTTTKETFDDGIHFAVFSWDATNSKYKIFVNGVELTTENNGADSALISGVTSPVFGKRAPLNDFYLDGGLSNIRLFNVSLTAAQVADLYNNPEKIVPTGVSNDALKLWLPMQEGAGTTAYDGSGNGNHGTISGATYTHGIGAPVSQTAVIDWNKGSNLFPYSNDYSQSNWSKADITAVADSGTSPDGNNNASLLYVTSNSSAAYLYDVLTASSAVYTISAFVKANGRNICWMYIQGSSTYGVAYFDLSDQSTQVVAGSSSTLTATITSVGNDWYKISATSSASFAISSGSGIGICDAKGSLNATTDGTNGILVYGLHLHSGNVGPYVPTLSTAQTSDVLLPAGLTTGRDITGVNLFENVRKQGALNLDGNSWAEVHDNASLDVTDAISLECWVYWDTSFSTAKGLFGKWASGSDCYLLYISDTTTIRFYINSSISTYGSLTNGWHHIVGTYDKTNRKLYVDGTLQDTDAMTADINTSALPVEIGRHTYSASKCVDNSIAQPRIYNRALTAEEVERNYSAGKNTYKN